MEQRGCTQGRAAQTEVTLSDTVSLLDPRAEAGRAGTQSMVSGSSLGTSVYLLPGLYPQVIRESN